jgi:hypothetical protein
MPTGDQNCLPHICSAKLIHRKIVNATNGSTGSSDVEEGEDNYDNKEFDCNKDDN